MHAATKRPLSHAQERLAFSQHLPHAQGASAKGMALHFSEGLDEARLSEAIRFVMPQFPIWHQHVDLEERFVSDPCQTRMPFLELLDFSRKALPLKAAREHAWRKLNDRIWQGKPPHFHNVVYNLDGNSKLWVFKVSALVGDMPSISSFIEKVLLRYQRGAAFVSRTPLTLAPDVLQADDGRQAHTHFWSARLAPCQPLFNAEGHGKAADSYRIDVLTPQSQHDRLRLFAKNMRTNPINVLHACIGAVLEATYGGANWLIAAPTPIVHTGALPCHPHRDWLPNPWQEMGARSLKHMCRHLHFSKQRDSKYFPLPWRELIQSEAVRKSRVTLPDVLLQSAPLPKLPEQLEAKVEIMCKPSVPLSLTYLAHDDGKLGRLHLVHRKDIIPIQEARAIATALSLLLEKALAQPDAPLASLAQACRKLVERRSICAS